MDVYKIYTNIDNQVACGSLLSDSYYKNTDNSWQARLFSRLADSGKQLC